MKKKANTIGDPIKIRYRDTKDGAKSIYLDYMCGGKRKFEFLKLYLLPGTSKEIKEQNRQTMLVATARKGQRLLDLQDEAKEMELAAPQGSQVRIVDYIEELCKHANFSEKTKKAYRNVARLVKEFYTERVTFRKVDKNFLKDFVQRLLAYTPSYNYQNRSSADQRLGNNSIIAFYSVLRSIIHKAYKDNIIPSNPAEEFKVSDYVKGKETHREYLELDELRRFAAVKTRHKLEQQAFVFSCLSGIRVSDIRALTWDDIKEVEGVYCLSIKQTKTKKRLSNPLSPEILNWLPEPGPNTQPTDIIFPLVAEQYVNDKIREIAQEAGIAKHLSFHSARHTCATLLLTLGADLYTVSKLLGHSRITTTEIYAKIVDKKKRAAVDMIPDFMV